MSRTKAAAAACLLSLAASATAQETPANRAAIAAGYKASFLCSDIFTAGMSQAEVEADDLTRIYPDYQDLQPRLKAMVDRRRRIVSVPFAPDMPPRIAAWRPGLGCAQLPVGAGIEAVARLPALKAPLALPNQDSQPWPQGDAGARVQPPARVAARLDPLVASAFDRKTFGEATETTGVVVVKDGRIVAERYRQGFDLHTPQRTWSAAKSISGTLIGIAVGKGLLQVEAQAQIPEWRSPGDPRSKITLANLLQMGSGLYSGRAGNRTDALYFGGQAVTETATAEPLEAPPGRRWRYANNDTLLAMRSLHAAIGDDQAYLAFPYRELFTPIGMTRTTPETDWRGDYVLSSQVWTTARDLARLGLLYQNDGVWQGRRILPAGWSRYVATPAPAQPDLGKDGKGAGYGAQFWLFGPRQGLPAGTYAAQGNRGQYLIIVPSEHLIVVRRGFDGGRPGDKQFEIAAFTADVIAALNAG